MSSSSSPVLVLELTHRWLRLLPAAALMFSGVCVAGLVLPQTQLAIWVLILSLGMAGWTLWRSGYDGRAVSRLTWQQDQHWQLQTRDGLACAAVLSSRSWWTPWLMCLKLRTASGQLVTVMAWRIELTATAWHHWQVRLRMEGSDATTITPEWV